MKNLFIVFFLFLGLSIETFVYSQVVENCENAIDDDGDGLIDINDTTDCKCKGIQDSVFIPSSLIPNPSFELYTMCPNGLAQLDKSVGWIQASSATSDYFNTCGYKDDALRGMPPQPLPAGNGYVGFLDIQNFPGRGVYKEYIGACLNSVMTPGKEYTLTFWVGFGRRGTNWGPRGVLNMGIFATSKCSNLPFGINPPGSLCPTRYPGWFELSRISVSGTNQWKKVIVKLRPTVNVEAIALGPACATTDGNYYYWMDELILEETVKFDSLKVDVAGNFCVDSIQLKSSKSAQLPINYQWYKNGIAIIGADKANFNIPKGDLGKYQLRVSFNNQCEYSKIFDYKIDQFVTEFKPEICQGDTVDIAGKKYFKSGVYLDTLVTAKGCDSILHIQVNEFPNFTNNLSFEICKGDSILFDGLYLKDESQFPFNYFTTQGCDSTVIVDLKFSPAIDIVPTIVPVLCAKDSNAELSIKINGGKEPFKIKWHTGDSSLILKNLFGGSFVVEVRDSLGCYATKEIEIPTPECFCFNVIPKDATCLNPFSGAAFIDQLSGIKPKDFILNGKSYILNNDSLKNLTGGNYNLTIIDSNGCEFNSVFNILIDSSFVYNLQFDKIICEGEFVEVGNKKYFTDGIYVDSLYSSGGCDSIISLNLKVNPVDLLNLDTTICNGSFVEVLGNRYSQSGTYQLKVKNQFNCDSTISLNLTVNPTYIDTIKRTICEGDFVKVGDLNFFQSGQYDVHLENQYKCDSLVVLQLIVNPNKKLKIDTTICFGKSVQFGNKTFNTTGSFILNEKTFVNCDSIVTINLIVGSQIVIDHQVVPIKCAIDSNAEIVLDLKGGSVPYKILWHTSDTTRHLKNLTGGIYYVEVIDEQGCIISKEIEIQAPPCFCFELDPVNGDCLNPNGSSVSIKQLSGAKASQYLINGKQIAVDNNMINKLNYGVNELIILDSNGCVFRKQFSVEFDSSYIQDLGVDTIYTTVGDSIDLVYNSNGLFNVARHNWKGSGSIICEDCRIAKILALSGQVIYYYSGKDQNGCEITFRIVVIAKQGFWVPNVFSPNGDGINDDFNLISDSSIDRIDRLQIWTRWGELIFDYQGGIPNTSIGAWNGRYNGQLVNPGVFVYSFAFRDKVGKSYKLAGDVTLVR